MITLNMHKLSELMEASGPKLISAVTAVRDDIQAGEVDQKHQQELNAIRIVDDMLICAFLLVKQESMQVACEYLIEEMMQISDADNADAVFTHLEKVKTIKKILQTEQIINQEPKAH